MLKLGVKQVWCQIHKFNQVFQATLSVLHSPHHFYDIWLCVGRDIAREPVV